jgi:hypothetical protein
MTRGLPMTYAHRLYHNQFVLGPRAVDFGGWAKTEIRPGLVASTHPDLFVTHAADGPRSLTLLGLLLDPEDAQRTDQAIVDGLLQSTAGDPGRLLRTTARYAGRWVLIADDGQRVTALPDPAGMRSLYYAASPDGVWCASQPGMLAQLLERPITPEAMHLIDSFAFRSNPEAWWPGVGSPYQGVEHLLPNHTLDLLSGTVARVWPADEIPPRTLAEAVPEVARMLRGIVAAASARFDLSISVTAGLDSRVALAASRGLPASYKTVRQLLLRDTHPDITVPAELLPRLGLQHEVIRAVPLVDPDFARIFKAQAPLAHNHYLADAYAILRAYGGRKVTVTGSVSEAIRTPRMGRPSIASAVSDREIARAWWFTTDPYAVRAAEQWRAGVGRTYNVDPNVLFYLEQRAANWNATTQLEFDTAWRDILALYNCRALIVTMLGVPEGERAKIYRPVIETLWPETLSAPINPHKHGVRLEIAQARHWAVKRLKLWAMKVPAVRRWRDARR